MRWHIWDCASIHLLFTFSGISLSVVKCQPQRYLLPPKKTDTIILCLHRVQWRSTRSVWMKVESMWASAPRMGRWDLSAHQSWLLILGSAAKNHQSGFFIFHNSASDSYKTHLISVKLYANDVGLFFIDGSSFTLGALTWSFYLLYQHFNPYFRFIKNLYQFWKVRRGIQSVSNQPSTNTLSMFPTSLLSCLCSLLPPSFRDVAVKICSAISPSPTSGTLVAQTRSCRKKRWH